MQNRKFSQELVKKLDKCFRTCTWLIVSNLRIKGSTRKQPASQSLLDSLKPLSDCQSPLQRCTLHQLWLNNMYRKHTDSSKFLQWMLHHQDWPAKVEKYQLSSSQLLGKLKNKSEEEWLLAQGSRTRDSKMSYKIDMTQREQLNMQSLQWSRGRRLYISSLEGF